MKLFFQRSHVFHILSLLFPKETIHDVVPFYLLLPVCAEDAADRFISSTGMFDQLPMLIFREVTRAFHAVSPGISYTTVHQVQKDQTCRILALTCINI